MATPVIGLAGWSGAGKTTLLTRVIPLLVAQGLRVSTIKHAHHDFDIDTPGKDSYEHRAAGATEVLVASPQRFALIRELRDEAEPALDALLRRMAPADLIVIEGFKAVPYPKIEVYRAGLGKPVLFPRDPHIVCIATDDTVATTLPLIALNDTRTIADMLVRYAKPWPGVR